MTLLLAAIFRGMSLPEIARAVIIVAAIIGIVCVALYYFEVWPPPWAVKMFWIVVVAFLAIVAIDILASM